jgi:phytoene dehydrogenase-like protein
MAKPVVVVGAGIAGLICARELHRAGVYVMLIEASDRIGGRLKTDVVEGFKLDHGFQVYLPAYPVAAQQLNLDALELGSYGQGAAVFDGKATYVLDSNAGFLQRLKMAKMPVFPLADKLRSAKWMEGLKYGASLAHLGSMKDETAESYLRNKGFGDEFIDRFARPFYGGIFLDRTLSFSAKQLVFVSKMIAMEGATSPAEGIQSIAAQVAEEVPSYLIRHSTRVSEIIVEKGRATGVRLDTNEVIDAEAVVVATDWPTAAALTGGDAPKEFLSATTAYFEVPRQIAGNFLAINGSGQGIVNHVAPVSAAQPACAPAGKHLAAATILGLPTETDEELAEKIKREVDAWAPEAGALMWRHLRTYRIPKAQMPQPVGFEAHTPSNVTGTAGLFVAGEFTENGSIEGAVRSGLAASRYVLSDRRGSNGSAA